MSASPRPSRADERPALTKRLEKLIAPPGFTGDAPGGPSRWSTERIGEWEPLRPELVVEVRYDQVTGDRFRHGTSCALAARQGAGAMHLRPIAARGPAGQAGDRGDRTLRGTTLFVMGRDSP